MLSILAMLNCRSWAYKTQVSQHKLSMQRLRLAGCDIWAAAKTGMYQVLLFSPEITATDESDLFIYDKVTWLQIGYFIVDKIHLIYEWGPEFCTVYETPFTMWAQLPKWTIFIGLMATLEPGKQTDTIIRSVGFKGNFNFEKCDCKHYKCRLNNWGDQNPCTGHEFHELSWLIPADLRKATNLPKWLVYYETIEMGHQLTLDLHSLLPVHLCKHGHQLICHMHSLICQTPSFLAITWASLLMIFLMKWTAHALICHCAIGFLFGQCTVLAGHDAFDQAAFGTALGWL